MEYAVAQSTKRARLKIGVQGMVAMSLPPEVHYARDVLLDPYYIACEPERHARRSTFH
jgi:hypothetical protein